MSEAYLPGRSVLLRHGLRRLVELAWDGSTVVDLGAGPGVVLRDVTRLLPKVRAVGLEIDPVLIRLSREAGSKGSVCEVRRTDLTDPGWQLSIRDLQPLSAVVAVQVLHYFPAQRSSALLCEIRRVLAIGGVLVHLDVVPDSAARPVLEPTRAWPQWWEQVHTHPLLADEVAQRGRLLATSPAAAEFHPDERTLDLMLQTAGYGGLVDRRRFGPSLLSIVRADGDQGDRRL